ncbi:MAG: T9SS type A sorting domain-containing protein [Ignavibacteria bacterium]|nr:T9SS type A sorting domain-containing protein [Ignavibacteria bacterium]MDP3829722.1 T9SS type A sorting domain-containing protein [Ignavibacteriaceae bacterium]
MKNISLLSYFLIVTLLFSSKVILAQWNHTGPKGGEIGAFCVSGINLFAAPWSGGIYRSTDNGTSWNEVNNGLTEINITVTALGADGSNIYAGTGGNGVFLSTNFGDSWVEINNSSTATTNVHAFVKSGTSLFMGSQGGGVHRTTDNGASWEQVNNGLLSLDVRDLAAMDTVIFAATWGGNKVFKSINNGVNWTQCNTAIIPPTLDDPCIAVSGNNVFLGDYGHGVFLSTDSGDNWVEVNNGIPANATIREIAVKDSNVFAATRGGGVFLTTNNGTSWNTVNIGLTTNLIESIIINTNQDLFAGTFTKGVFRSTDNGANWFESNTNLNANTIAAYTTITNGAGGHYLLAGTSNGVYMSTDDGIVWNFLGLDDKWVTGLAVLDSNIFASTMGTGVFRSTDGGASWTPSGLANRLLQTIYTNGTDLFAGIAFYGGAQRSTNRGTTWASIPGLASKWVMSFTENENYMFAGAMFGGAYRSSNGGGSFTTINNGLSNNNVSTLAVMDSSIFAGTGDANGVSAAGVFRSNNNGDSWTQINNGLPPTLMVWSLAVTGNNIFASSSSSGQNKVADVYLSTDRGENWSSVSTGLISNYIQAVFIHNTNIFAGTLGSSTWWRPLSEMIPGLLPFVPTNLTALADTFSVNLNWTDNSDNELGFKIERKDDSLHIAAPWILIDSVGANVTAYTDIGLTPYTTYSYRIYAFNEFGSSPMSDSIGTVTIIPVELTSFTASISKNNVILNWTTATEVNNQGFEIQRLQSAKGGEKLQDWEKVCYVAGNGTTTDPKSYSFTDNKIETGTYSYRLKQIDFDGTYSYSKIIEVEVDLAPKEFALYQNYPNPFNPSTIIKYSLPFKSSVKVEVFNMLGESAGVLINSVQETGYYEVNWNAGNLASGIYFYRLEAKSLDAPAENNFFSTKKMILLR